MKKSLLGLIFVALSPTVFAACGDAPYSFMADDRCSDIINTKHNFAASSTVTLPGGTGGDNRKVKAVSNDEVCVYCHTPHGDPNVAGSDRPMLWNRALGSTNYTERYTSSSLKAGAQNVGQGSRMCLSCHDGTVAIGQVDVVNGRLTRSVSNVTTTPSGNIEMTGPNVTAGGMLAPGTDGYTSDLGTDFRNDHPFGFIYNTALANADGELQDPATSDNIAVRVGNGVAQNNQVLNTSGSTVGTAGADNPLTSKTRVALPLESLAATATNGFMSVQADGTVECTTCHDPHIRSTNTSVDIKFLRLHRFQQNPPTLTGASEPPFDINRDINCAACHRKKGWSSSVHAQEANTYTSDAISLREFPTNTKVWEASCLNCHDPHTETGANWLLRGGADDNQNSAIEQTCFACHGNNPVINNDTGKTIANIEALNALGSGAHKATDSSSGTELHNPQSADLDETQANLQQHRHVTCSDCHNPHRMVAKSLIDNSTIDSTTLGNNGLHNPGSNIISGDLNGVSGIEPDFTTAASFDPYNPASGMTYTALKGVIASDNSNASTVVTKEYQVCMKCHTDYSDVGATGIGTVNGVNNMKKANIAMEFSDKAMSYHPVVRSSSDVTHSTNVVTDMNITDHNNFVSGFQNVGTQTMYCSDCHTSDVSGAPKGPHGSQGNNNLLSASGDSLCVSCHKADQYQNATGAVQSSGFSCQAGTCANAEAAGQNTNLHIFHASKAAGGVNTCTDCHVATPHGWKYKSLLANTNDATYASDTRYYVNAKAKIDTMQASGHWTRASCGANGGCHN